MTATLVNYLEFMATRLPNHQITVQKAIALTMTMAENLNADFWLEVRFNAVTDSYRLETHSWFQDYQRWDEELLARIEADYEELLEESGLI
ncbi:hypothetical protein ACFP3T_04775 [Lactiplantibacillus dongliensis]|uniref:Phage protein n=1 Tax=Lactiplantibacillus dongliensis TaxID=2559919 RepID=A0ABW1R6H8_9LACO|nr:hypothetical protein [Lactiplantibacillus dongliensis]